MINHVTLPDWIPGCGVSGGAEEGGLNRVFTTSIKTNVKEKAGRRAAW